MVSFRAHATFPAPKSRAYTSQNPATGSYEQAVNHIGLRSPRYTCEVPLSEGSVKMFCAMVLDANPVYWDSAHCDVFGGAVAPPALLQSVGLPLPWRPGPRVELALAAFAVPLPGRTLINVSTEAVYHRPVFVGERFSFFDEVVDVSPERQTRLGVGHFVSTVLRYQDEALQEVASITNIMFRFGDDR